MKLFISADIEGVAGVVDWDQCGPEDGPSWQEARELMTAEVNAAIEGALAGGMREVVVNDAHGHMRTLLPRLLHRSARLVQGRSKPMYMLEGADSSCAMAFFVGYHGAAGTRAGVLNHTYFPQATRVNGFNADETLINALVLGVLNVPVQLVSGDEQAAAAARELLGKQVQAVATKRGISRLAAESLHPEVACERIREAARKAVAEPVARPYRLPPPYRFEIDLATTVMADRAELIPGVERAGGRTVAYTCNDVLTAYRAYQAMMFLARTAA